MSIFANLLENKKIFIFHDIIYWTRYLVYNLATDLWTVLTVCQRWRALSATETPTTLSWIVIVTFFLHGLVWSLFSGSSFGFFLHGLIFDPARDFCCEFFFFVVWIMNFVVVSVSRDLQTLL